MKYKLTTNTDTCRHIPVWGRLETRKWIDKKQIERYTTEITSELK